MAYNSTALAGAYGGRPVAPPIAPTAPQSTASAIQLGQQAYSQLPFYNESLQNVGGNIRDMTAGRLPEDVNRQIAQRAAERGIATGSPGSPNMGASYLRDIGLTSLDLTGRGQQSLLAQLPALPGAAISQNPSLYVNPSQQYEADLQRSLFNAAPDPSAAARTNLQAAQSGYGAGYSSVGGGFQPGQGLQSSAEWWNAPEPNYQPLVAYGPGGGPSGAGGGTGGSVDAIVSRYGSSNYGGGGPAGRGGNQASDNVYMGQYDPLQDPWASAEDQNDAWFGL